MQTGQLMTRVSSDVDVVRMFSSAGLALLLRVLLMIIGSMVMLLLTDWQLSLIMFAVAAISGLFIRYLMLKATRLFTVVQQRLGALNTLGAGEPRRHPSGQSLCPRLDSRLTSSKSRPIWNTANAISKWAS